MITFADSSPYSRRSFLQVGSLGLGGLSLSQLMGWRASAAKAGIPLKNKSVVFLFMHGGPPQQETFDPKMEAPAEIRSSTGEVKTTIPGVTFGGTFEKLAERARRLAIVRSYTTGNGNHDIKPIVGKDSPGLTLAHSMHGSPAPMFQQPACLETSLFSHGRSTPVPKSESNSSATSSPTAR